MTAKATRDTTGNVTRDMTANATRDMTTNVGVGFIPTLQGI